jgi:CRISPR-associated protein Cas5a/b/c
MIGLIVDVEFVWGFQARVVGLSKTSPSFYYPPPTTFLGAVAEVIAKENNIGEDVGKLIIDELSRNLLALGLRPLNCVPIKYEDLNRIIMIRVSGNEIKSPLPTKPYDSFDSPARGKTILSSLDKNPPRIRWLMVFKSDEMKVVNSILRSKIDEISLKEEHLWKIQRIGSKESRVSVINVKKLKRPDLQYSEKGYVITNYSFPLSSLSNGDEIVRRWENEVYINPFEENIYSLNLRDNRNYDIFNKYYQNETSYLKVFKIPIMISALNPPNYSVLLADGWKAYSTRYEGRLEVVIGK